MIAAVFRNIGIEIPEVFLPSMHSIAARFLSQTDEMSRKVSGFQSVCSV